ncbi:hypothetical protein Hypma_014971 [Hypsizygus marmoreus]|uniref:Uncharacterized protein n=1 Tax=Hypsizygus marmoreus TaxID=39966 RepID=A0A369KDL5_HYPMA|nr:hypothetical protein Hypma_014971 [Hypsizygus marmoreus]
MPMVDILILGAGWTSTFLIPLCTSRSLTHASTTRTGRDFTIPFSFSPDSDDLEPYRVLPDAHTVLITFPIDRPGAPERLVRLYRASRSGGLEATGFIQLGTTGIWDGPRKAIKTDPPTPVENKWYDRHTPFVPNARASAEIELLGLSCAETPTTVLNLAGLWGGGRSMRNWVGRVAPTKEVLRCKGSLHMIHGLDVARAILAIHGSFSKAAGQRWILTDGRVYDWWDLASAWGSPPSSSPFISGSTSGVPGGRNGEENNNEVEVKKEEDEDKMHGPHARWVRELMRETGVRALPRDVGLLGRAMDSREFWEVFGLGPVRARLEGW